MRKAGLIAVFLVLVIPVAWYVFWGKSLANERRELDRQIQAEQQKLSTYRMAVARLTNKIDEFRRLNSDSERPTPLSGENEVIGLYKSLDSLCRQPGYQLDEITPSLNETIRYLRQWAISDSTLSMPIRIKINGDFKSLGRLIQTVERHQNFLRMDDCRIHASEKLYPDCTLDMTFIAGLGNRMELFGHE
jgi:Tfp pilus assembly protein PilO